MSKKRKVQMFCAFVSGILCLVTIFNPLPNKSNLAFAGQANHLVINKIQIDGLLGAGGTEDDWVELYNPTASSISLVGWSIQKASSNGATSSPFKEPLSGSIPAHGYYLIVRNNVVTTASLKSKADHLASDSFLLAAGNIVSLEMIIMQSKITPIKILSILLVLVRQNFLKEVRLPWPFPRLNV